jgi:hypothetical protein
MIEDLTPARHACILLDGAENTEKIWRPRPDSHAGYFHPEFTYVGGAAN